MEIIVYSKNNCPDCDQAKALLKSRGLEYDEKIIVSEDDADGENLITKEDLLKVIPTARSVPQIIIDGALLKSLQELKDILVVHDLLKEGSM